MKKINILVAAMLSVFLVSSAVSAGELSVTGSVKASITTGGSGSTAGKSETGGRALAISNDIDFNATGETDNGWAWTWQTQLDAGAIDDTKLTIATEYGTIGLFGTEGGLNFKHGGSQMALGYGSQIGSAGGMVDPDDIGTYNNIQYHLPAGLLPLGIGAKAGITMGGSATSEPGDSPLGSSASAKNGHTFEVTMAPVEGLSLGGTYFTIDQESTNGDSGQKEENGAYYASYKIGQVGVGYSKAFKAPASGTTVATYNAYENTSYSVGFAVNDSLSISYGVENRTEI